MIIFVYDVLSNGVLKKTVGVEAENEKDALNCIRSEYPNNTVNLVRRVSALLTVDKSIEEDYFDADYERFDRIQKEYGLKTIWSLYEVKNMEDLSPFTFNRLELRHMPEAAMTMSFNHHTWMEIWEMADKLIRIHDPAHPYIEGLKIHKNTLLVTTGS